jgi:hypothetical protein
MKARPSFEVFFTLCSNKNIIVECGRMEILDGNLKDKN